MTVQLHTHGFDEALLSRSTAEGEAQVHIPSLQQLQAKARQDAVRKQEMKVGACDVRVTVARQSYATAQADLATAVPDAEVNPRVAQLERQGNRSLNASMGLGIGGMMGGLVIPIFLGVGIPFAASIACGMAGGGCYCFGRRRMQAAAEFSAKSVTSRQSQLDIATQELQSALEAQQSATESLAVARRNDGQVDVFEGLSRQAST